MYAETLLQIGVPKEQALIYDLLVQDGKLTAGKISRHTNIKRGLVYKSLERLIEKNLVQKQERIKKPAIFSPTHPILLRDFVQKQKKQALDAEKILTDVLPSIITTYNMQFEKPAVSFYEGLQDLEKIYNEIIKTKETAYFYRPVYEKKYDKLLPPILNRFFRNKAKHGIKSIAISPADELATQETHENDKRFLIDRVYIPKEEYNHPVEINIYGDKTAFLSFGDEVIGVVIHSPQIASAMKAIFQIVHKQAKNRSSTKLDTLS